jgi:hypothetical protein
LRKPTLADYDLNPAAILFDSGTAGNRWVGTRMRILVAGCFLLAGSPSFAQKFLNSEPVALDPYAVVYVNDGSCSVGKVLKITGSIRGQHRKKFCVQITEVTSL